MECPVSYNENGISLVRLPVSQCFDLLQKMLSQANGSYLASAKVHRLVR